MTLIIRFIFSVVDIMDDCNKYSVSIFGGLISRFRNNSFDVEKYSIEEVERINKIFEKLDVL